jgi:quaternary ammonium compound-resistance protein SugE
MAWLILIVAGLFEVGFAACLAKSKDATGTEKTFWYTGFFVALSLSMLLLMKAVETLPIGTAYAVWTGIGAVGQYWLAFWYLKTRSASGASFLSRRLSLQSWA